MRGKKALWVPGSDHAGFETQVVYEKQLEKEGRSRFDMKPEDLHKEIYDFVMSKKSFMENQLRELRYTTYMQGAWLPVHQLRFGGNPNRYSKS